MSHFPDSPNLIIGWFKDELNAQAYEAVSGIKEKLTNYYHAHEFMTEDFNLIVDAITDLLHKDRAEVRRDALLEERAKWLPLWEINNKLVAAIEDGGVPVRQVEKILTQIYVVMQRLAADLGQGKE